MTSHRYLLPIQYHNYSLFTEFALVCSVLDLLNLNHWDSKVDSISQIWFSPLLRLSNMLVLAVDSKHEDVSSCLATGANQNGFIANPWC